jgi:ATP-binding protein involved in chromosome partitioning
MDLFMLAKQQQRQIEPENRVISANTGNVIHGIIVLGGGGGVGITTISISLAHAHLSRGGKSGCLNADVADPNAPKILGSDGDLHSREHRIIPLTSDDVKAVSAANMIEARRMADSGQPLVFACRGTDIAIAIAGISERIENIFDVQHQ